MSEEEVRELLRSLAGARVVIGAEVGSPESARDDTFCFHDPDGTGEQTMPYATIVTHDTPGWDEVSDLDRPGAFRVNLAVGRDHLPQVDAPIDPPADDVVLPHPQYAVQGWVCVVNPGPRTTDELRRLVDLAHDRAVRRHR